VLEIEVKILGVDADALAKKLELLGAKKVFDGVLKATWFDNGGRLRKQGKVLRLRRAGNKTVLCSKSIISKTGAKVMDEREVEVMDYEATKKVLEGLGFAPTLTLSKKRVSYEIKGTRFEIDSCEGIPPFLEIEGSNEEQVFEWVERLGYKKEDAKPWTFSEVFDYYGIEIQEVNP